MLPVGVDRPGHPIHAIGPRRSEHGAEIRIADGKGLGEGELKREVLARVIPHDVGRLGAVGLGLEDAYFHRLNADLREKRDRLRGGLAAAGFTVLPSAGTYFLTVDIRPLGERDGLAFCRSLRVGVEGQGARAGQAEDRQALARVIDEAVTRLQGLAR